MSIRPAGRVLTRLSALNMSDTADAPRMRLSFEECEVIAPNFKKRLSGVTSTIIQLVPLQWHKGVRIATLSPKGSLPDHLPFLSWWGLVKLWRKPVGRPFRIWHARRNIEMLAGLILRDVLRMKLRLVFTSAAQRHHRHFTRFLIRHMDRVIATSARSGSFLRVPYQIIRHGIDLTHFSPPREGENNFAGCHLGGTYVVGCFGRLRWQKGTDLFVDAMIDLLPRYPQWVALISGRVTAQHQTFVDELKQKIAAADLEKRILFLGEVPDIVPWYQRLSLYVAPSRNEGFGLTPLEAMACQTAVVTSDAGAYCELVEADCGRVVPAGDAQALTRAIEAFLANPEMAKAAGKKALAHVRANFPLEREAEAIGSVYEELFTSA